MADAYHHALSAVRQWGGCVEDYLPIENFFDSTKRHHGDSRHRALRHHTLGIAECVERFGTTITLRGGRVIPTRWVAERHVIEDHGYLPTVSDWLREIRPRRWMGAARQLSRELESPAANDQQKHKQQGHNQQGKE
jgi:hypothetical protein